MSKGLVKEIKMNRKLTNFTSLFWGSVILALCLLISGCTNFSTTSIGETRSETESVDLGSADEAKVLINMNAGELTIAGGAETLMEATFRYNVADWQPTVDYSLNGNQGVLTIEHQNDDIPVGGGLVNEWNIALNNTLPIALEIAAGAGETELDLRGLDLTDLQLEMGAGNSTVDLSSALNHDINATIQGGVGNVMVKLPTDMGVRVSTSTGIGGLTNAGLIQEGDDYVNEAYGESPHTLFLTIEAGIGAIELLAQ
jgi:hypothetical protein